MAEIEELAQAARQTPAMVRGVALAEWFGEGRDLPEEAPIRREDVAEVAKLLDLPFQDEDDFLESDEFLLAWTVASGAGFLEYAHGDDPEDGDDPDQGVDRAQRSGGLDLWLTAGPDDALEIWKDTLLGTAGFQVYGVHTQGSAEGVEVFMALQLLARVTQPITADEARQVARQSVEENLEDADFDENEEVDSLYVLGEFGAMRQAVAAVQQEDGTEHQIEVVELTGLGRWLVARLQDSAGQPTLEPDDDVRSVVDVLRNVPEELIPQVLQPWLEARTLADAATELLTYADQAPPHERMVTMTLIRDFGPDAKPAWEKWAATPGAVASYARLWVAEDDQAEPEQGDLDWIIVDICAATALSAPGPGQARQYLEAQGVLEAARDLVARIDSVDHPYTAQVKELLA